MRYRYKEHQNSMNSLLNKSTKEDKEKKVNKPVVKINKNNNKKGIVTPRIKIDTNFQNPQNGFYSNRDLSHQNSKPVLNDKVYVDFRNVIQR